MIYDHPSSFLTDMGPKEPREEVQKEKEITNQTHTLQQEL
jgi:hypothetical protein